MTGPITVLLATTQPLLRAGLSIAIGDATNLRLVGEAATGQEARRLCQAFCPAVALLDQRLTRPSTLETAALLRRLCPETRLVILAPPTAVAAVRGLIALGAAGALSLDDAPATVGQAVEIVGGGGTWCSPPFLAALARGEDAAADRLTAREGEVLALLAEGRRNAEIAAALGVALRTVEHHVSHLLAKLGARSRAEAIRRAQARGLLGPAGGADSGAA